MKKFLLFAAIAAFVSSCSDNDLCVRERPVENELRIAPLIAAAAPSAAASETRVGYTGTSAAWAENDAIGLFCTPINASNVQFAVTNTSSTPVWTPASAIYWQDGTTLHKFTAYYPYAAGNTNAAAVKVPALNAQTGIPLNQALDLMISNNQNTTGVSRTGGAVALTFTHALSLLQFDIKLGAGFAANTTLGSFTLAGASSEKMYTADAASTIALATGNITVGASTSTQTFTPVSSPVLSSAATPVYAFILPGTYTASNLTITIKDGGTAAYTTAVLPLTTLSFAAGSKYSWTITISRSAITISNPTITDWTVVSGTPLTPTI